MKSTAKALLNRIEFPVLAAGLAIACGLWGLVELMGV
ncbi:MAG: phosphoesterase, partial [Mesorhizobium sp.]